MNTTETEEVVTTELVEAKQAEIMPLPAPSKDIVVLARNPEEMVNAQQGLIDWFERKIVAEQAQLAECEENLTLAKTMKTKTNGWKRQVTLASKRVVYYEKGLTALNAGYFIVPDFPIQLIAVRTKNKQPPYKPVSSNWNVPDVAAQQLPQGEGRYVDPAPLVREYTVPGNTPETRRSMSVAVDFQEDFDFPFKMVKPQILADLNKAMKRKIFDEIGVLPARARNTDPMIIGCIKNKIGAYSEKKLYFLITWWIDTRDL